MGTFRNDGARFIQNALPGNFQTFGSPKNWINNTRYGYRKSADIEFPVKSYLSHTAFRDHVTSDSSESIDDIKNNFLYDYGKIQNYASRQIVLDDYYSKVGFMQEKMSVRILAALVKAQIEMTVDNMDDLKKARTPKEAVAALESVMAGEKDPKKQEFIKTLQVIEKKSRDVAQKYREMTALQNPIVYLLSDRQDEIATYLSENESFFIGRCEGIYEKYETITEKVAADKWQADYNDVHNTYTEQKLLEDMKALASNTALGNTTNHALFPPLFRKYMLTHYKDGVTTKAEKAEGLNFTQSQVFLNDIEMLENKVKVEDLENRHSASINFTRELLMETFHRKGGLSLSEAIPTFVGEMTEAEMALDRDKKRGNFHRSILRAAMEMNPVDVAGMGFTNESLADAVTNEYLKFFGEYSESIKNIDSVHGLTFHRDRPGGSVQEEIFQKMFIDGIYNRMMESSGGTELYRELGGIIVSKSKGPGDVIHENIVDTISNQENGAYSLVHNNPEYKNIENDAVDLHNLSLIFDKSANNQLSRQHAKELLESGNKFLSPEQKASVADNVDLIYRSMELTKEDMGITDKARTSEQASQDFISGHNARNYFVQNYAGKNRGILAKMMSGVGLHLYGKMQLELFSCLGKAENPAVSSHSSTSETRGCMEKFAQQIDQTIQKREEVYGNPMAAMFGLTFLILVLNALSYGERNVLYKLAIDSVTDEAEGISFIRGSEDEVEKVFREKAIMLDKSVVSEAVAKKGNLDEYLFRTVKAQHDFHIHHNRYLNPPGTGILTDIQNASGRGDLARMSREGIRAILDKTKMTDYFNVFVADHNKKVVDIFEGEVDVIKMKLDMVKFVGGKLEAAGYDFVNPNSAANMKIVDKLKNEAISYMGSNTKYKDYPKYYELVEGEGKHLVRSVIDEVFAVNENTGNQDTLMGASKDTLNEVSKEFLLLSKKLMMGVEKGGIPPSKLQKHLGGMDKHVLLVREKLADNQKLFDKLQEDTNTKLAENREKVAKGEMTLDELKAQEAEMLERVRKDSIALTNDAEVMERFSEADNILGAALVKLERMITALLSSLLKPYNTEGMSKKEEQAFLAEKADPLFSQTIAFSGGNGNKEDDEEAEAAFKARYSGDLSEDMLFQDLRLFEDFNEMIHNKEYTAPRGMVPFVKGLLGKKVNDIETMPTIPGKYKHVSEGMTAIKVLLRETFVTSEQHLDGSRSRREIFGGLYQSRPDDMLNTADLHVGLMDQEDGEHVQIITVDKSENPMNIKSAIDAVDILAEKYDKRRAGDLTDKQKPQLFKNASNYLARISGLSISKDRYKSGDVRSLRRPADSFSIRIDDMHTQADMDRLQEDLYKLTGEDAEVTSNQGANQGASLYNSTEHGTISTDNEGIPSPDDENNVHEVGQGAPRTS